MVETLTPEEILYLDARLSVVLSDPHTFAPAYAAKLIAISEKVERAMAAGIPSSAGAVLVPDTSSFDEFVEFLSFARSSAKPTSV